MSLWVTALVVHDEQGSLGYLAMLAEMTTPQLPVPIGVFRRIQEPTFEASVRSQIEQITEEKGPGDLRSVLYTDNTWKVG